MNNLNRVENRKRPIGKTMPNMYLITIPRCDLPKKFIFRGLEPLCNRLLVSKEAHTISYIDSCCKNSSVKNKNLNSDKKRGLSGFFNKEKYYFNKYENEESICVSGDISNECEVSGDVSNLINCLSETTNSNTNSNVCTLQINNATNNEQKLNNFKTSQAINNYNMSKKCHDNHKMFKEDEDSEWIHCKSHLHIFAGKIKIF